MMKNAKRKMGVEREKMEKRKLIVIEGLDGSGKATQTELLQQSLQKEEKLRIRKIFFPNYDSPSSAVIKMYLEGQFGTDPKSVNAYAASAFYAVDRYAGFKKDWGEDYENGLIIADRYTTSNAIHQCAKLPREEWDVYLTWLFEFEYEKMGIPKPDIVFYLKVDPEVSQKLMMKRYQGNELKKDIHEKNVDYLKRCEIAAEYCSKKYGWKVVECCTEKEMKTIEEIHKEILRMLYDGREE